MMIARSSVPRWPAILLLAAWVTFVILVGLARGLSMPTHARIVFGVTAIAIGTPLLIATAGSVRMALHQRARNAVCQ
ncbi:hypothetical protein [Nocardia sp. IFM 10818]